MRLSGRIIRARVSATVHLSGLARDLRRAGHEIIDLGEGEPDFDTPHHITEAAFEAARHGATRYTDVAGTPELREAIALQFRRLNGPDVGPEDVIVGTGAKQLLFNAFMSSLNPGDEVIIPAPCWVSYPEMVELADGKPVIARCCAATGFKLAADALERLVTAKSRWLILNSPCNPTGAVYTSRELSAIADVLRKHPALAVMCDDIYQEIVFEPATFTALSAVAPDLSHRVMTVHGVSKTYAMTGWRVGYAAGPSDLIAAMTKLQGQSTTNASSVGQAAACAALAGPQDFLGDWRATYRRRCDLVRQQLSGVAGLEFAMPDGAFYHFPDCTGLYGKSTPSGGTIRTDDDVSLYLLESAGVVTVPGSAFFAPGHLRICFARSEDLLARACQRIRTAIDSLAA